MVNDEKRGKEHHHRKPSPDQKINQGNQSEMVLPDERYIDKVELAKLLSVSVRTIEKDTHRIIGRVKIGRAVRFYLPDIHKALLTGKNLFKSGKCQK